MFLNTLFWVGRVHVRLYKFNSILGAVLREKITGLLAWKKKKTTDKAGGSLAAWTVFIFSCSLCNEINQRCLLGLEQQTA